LSQSASDTKSGEVRADKSRSAEGEGVGDEDEGESEEGETTRGTRHASPRAVVVVAAGFKVETRLEVRRVSEQRECKERQLRTCTVLQRSSLQCSEAYEQRAAEKVKQLLVVVLSRQVENSGLISPLFRFEECIIRRRTS
jgi:hypothetical protein